MLVIFILMAGLRYRLGVDTTAYLDRFYYRTPSLYKLKWDDLAFGTDPLYTLLNLFVLTLGGKFYVVQLLNAAFVNILIFKYIKKHTDAVFISLFIYFIWQYAAINMEEMRASMSLAVCLFANDYMLEKKWAKGMVLYLIGCLFHASTIVVMVMPLLFFLHFNKVGVVVLIGALIFGFVIQSYVNDYLALIELNDAIEGKAEKYAESEKYMEKDLNIFGYIRAVIPYLYGVVSIWLMRSGRLGYRLTRMEPLIMIYLVFGMLNLGVPIAYRFMRFYVIYYIMFIAEFMLFLFQHNIERCSKNLIYTKTLVIMFPFFLFIALGRLAEDKWPRYHPYSSIFDQQLDRKREILYSEISSGHSAHVGKY